MGLMGAFSVSLRVRVEDLVRMGGRMVVAVVMLEWIEVVVGEEKKETGGERREPRRTRQVSRMRCF